MIDTSIIIDENPEPEIRDAILRPLQAFNAGQAGPLKVANLAIMLKDEKTGDVTGGLWGRSGGDWLFVELLVVPENMRGRGIGRKLMQQAEAVARARDCIGIWLDTFTFQARGFYEKLGYEVFGQIDNYPSHHARLFLKKRIDTITASS